MTCAHYWMPMLCPSHLQHLYKMCLTKANDKQIMTNSWTHMITHVTENRTDRSSHQMQHIQTQPSLRGKYFSWHSLTLFWILIVEQVSTPLHNRRTVRGVETRAMYQLFQKQVAHLCALAMRWLEKKKHIHYFNWPLPATAAKTSAPDVTSQSPRSESFSGICFMPNCHGNQTFPSQVRLPLHWGSAAKAAINTEPWGGSTERINDVSAVPWEVQLPSLASSGGAMKSQDWVVLWRERWPFSSH